jgi:hypothetical protein
MGYLFALMLLLASLSTWTNVFLIRRSRLTVQGNRFDLVTSDQKLVDVAAELALAGFERGSLQKSIASRTQQQQQSAKSYREKQKRLRKLRNRKAAPKIIPRSQSLTSNSWFSSCMLIKDDNEILNEWIAYHYFVLKLRKIIIAVDPLSSESPSTILNKWRQHTDLEVFEWHDGDYMPISFLKNGYPPAEYLQKQTDFNYEISAAALLEISNHRYRQRVFLAQCMKEHRKLGNSWVIHIDTDEYIVASKLLRQTQPDYLIVPPLDEPSSMFNLLRQVVEKTPEQVSYPCISMLRLLFGSVESKSDQIEKSVPPAFNATQFETLRWRYHGTCVRV